jgi:hypothetical protein
VDFRLEKLYPKPREWSVSLGYGLKFVNGPLPPFLKISRIMGLAGNSRQNLDVKELTYQALESKGVRGVRRWVDPTVTASVMIAQILDEDKVGCHKEECGEV